MSVMVTESCICPSTRSNLSLSRNSFKSVTFKFIILVLLFSNFRIQTLCNVPGCHFIAESLLEFENHYNSSHRYTCGQCKKNLPSPHLLDLHIQETHDSFFSVMAERKSCVSRKFTPYLLSHYDNNYIFSVV